MGMKWQGKTYFTKAVLRQIPKFIFIDPKYQASEIGYPVHYPDRIALAFKTWHKVVYQPAKGYDTEQHYTTAYDAISELSNLTLGIDEIDEHANSYGYICDSFREIIRRGRLQGIGVIGNTRRPSLIHKDIRANTDHAVTFQMQELDDVEYMARWFVGSRNLQDVRIMEEKIRNLQAHYSLYFNVKQHTVTPQAPI